MNFRFSSQNSYRLQEENSSRLETQQVLLSQVEDLTNLLVSQMKHISQLEEKEIELRYELVRSFNLSQKLSEEVQELKQDNDRLRKVLCSGGFSTGHGSSAGPVIRESLNITPKNLSSSIPTRSQPLNLVKELR
eukprot:TRINITY_DN3721_c0_g1_i12.p1 TRINITY_DN3721_c0_g1~~TRINITY_DN3721_c0_g1_i12.p1  ORF type:complete len:134 (+),score=26.29 TRINITY_DN3721_c0_g1_i12:683-1084(+)